MDAINLIKLIPLNKKMQHLFFFDLIHQVESTDIFILEGVLNLHPLKYFLKKLFI